MLNSFGAGVKNNLNALVAAFLVGTQNKGAGSTLQLVSDQMAASERERLDRIAAFWQAYAGDLEEPLLPTKTDKKGKDNLKLNYSSLVVDIGVAFLFGKLLDFSIDGKTDEQSDADVQWLDDCWEQNNLMATLLEIGINGGVTGHAFAKLMPADAGQDYPQVLPLDPSTVFATTAPDNYKKVLKWRVQWNASDPDTGKPCVYRQLVETDGGQWHITDQINRDSSNVWLTYHETPWPYAWAPIHHCQNLPMPNVFWGRSDLEDVVAVNDKINFSVSNTGRIERVHAHPKTVVTGMGKSDVNIDVDGVIYLPSEKAAIKNLEMQSDLTASKEWFQIRKSALHEITRIPECATGKVDNLGALSGVALQTLFQPVVQKTETKKVLYGPMLAALNSHLLELGGKGRKRRVVTTWPDVLPKNDQEEANTALVDSQLGVSKKTLLTKRGYDAEAESTQKEQEDKQAQTMGAEMLSSFEKGQLPGQGAGQTQNGADNGNSA